jgi:hypothetical protein
MALSNREDIQRELQHAMTLPDRQKNAVRSVMGAADEAEEGDLEEVQRLLQMIVDADFEEPDLL